MAREGSRTERWSGMGKRGRARRSSPVAWETNFPLGHGQAPGRSTCPALAPATRGGPSGRLALGRQCGQRKGLTLAEVVISLMILAVAVTAGVQALGSFSVGGMAWQDRSTAIELANALMAEIDSLPFADPAGSSTIGLESGETPGDRSTFDDIDDYDGWDACPPKDKTNAEMSAYGGFRQQVSVAFDNSLSTATGVAFAAGNFKKITVTISKDDKVLAKLVTVRAQQRGMPGSG
jgi:prepilin-type N-terminal cleavage/methylation domain-containing protein